VETEEEEEDPEELSQLQKEAGDDLPEDILEGKYKEKEKIVSPVKVTLTPSKENEGEAEPTEEILALETEEEEEEEEKTETEKKFAHPQLWEKCLVMTEQPEEYDSEEDPEYIPPPVILDTSFEYDEFIEEEEVISDNEVELLKADAAKDLEAPRCYIPIWVPVESPCDKIQRAMEELEAKEKLEATVITEATVSNDASVKDTESDGKKETDTTEATITSGLSPTTKDNKSPKPKPQRERKKSKSKSGEEKSADEEEKMEKAEDLTPPKTPPKVDTTEDPKKSTEESSESPKKSVGEEELNTVQN